jgi:tetraacyldisaccharide 4'-kinase
MRAPGFWWTPPETPALAARLLSPLAALTAAATARRLRQGAGGAWRAGVPVICLGNLVAGGAGKTPATMALAARLAARGVAVAVVSRGYGGRLAGPLRVDPARHRAAEVGDEPLLLATLAPTYVARDRAAGVRMAEAAGAGAILLDDGFQNPSVARDLSLVVVDAERAFGNARCLPAGPLREPVAAGMARAQATLAIGPAAAQTAFAGRWGDLVARPLLTGRLEPLATGMDWRGQRVLAFAGIARPERFFATLAGLGAEVVRAVPLADHAPLAPALVERLLAEARSLGAEPVTTEKDAVRLPPAWRGRVLILPVRLRLDDPAALDALLAPLVP